MSGLSSLLKWTAALVAVVYVIGLGLWAIGTNGLFGMEQDQLSSIVLEPLGWPWTSWSADDQLYMAAPALNVIVLWVLAKIVGPRR